MEIIINNFKNPAIKGSCKSSLKLEILVDHAQNRGEPKNFAFY